MKIIRKKFAITLVVLLALVSGWVLYARTSQFRIKTVLIEALYPVSSSVKPDPWTRLRLLAGMSSANTRKTSAMAQELVELGEPVLPLLAEAANAGPANSNRSNVAWLALRTMASTSPEARKTITAILLDKGIDSDIRVQAAYVLFYVRPPESSGVAALLTVMQEPSGVPRFEALGVLAHIDPQLAAQRGIAIVRNAPPRGDGEWSHWLNALSAIAPSSDEARSLMEEELARWRSQGRFYPRGLTLK